MKTFETTRQEAKNFKNVSYLLYFLKELTPEEANLLLYSSEDEVREYAIKYADRKTKIDRLLVEYNSNIVKGILNTIGELTPEEANKLLYSSEEEVREYAIKYANRKSKIDRLFVVEYYFDIVKGILNTIGELTTEEANKLLRAKHTYVRKYAIKYADRKSKIDRLFVENDSDIVKSILSSIDELTPEEVNQFLREYVDMKTGVDYILKKYDISDILKHIEELTTREANQLIRAYNAYLIKKYAIRYVDRKSKLDLLLVESVCSMITDILKYIGELTPEEANQLLKANHHYVREYALKYADRQSKINHLLIEDNYDIIDSILRSLDETPYYLTCKREELIAYFAKYAERESKIEWLLGGLHDSDSVNSILNSLGELTVEEANKLLNSKNRMIKIYAMRNVNSKDLAELREIIVKGLIKWL